MHKTFLQPGEYFVGHRPHRVSTLLGSCVSIVIWHPRTRAGAMSHCLLPTRGKRREEDDVPDARYADEAIWLMLRDLRQYGVSPEQCEAKIFGGGNMFPGVSVREACNIGRRNGEAAQQLLARHELRIVSSSLYGPGYRRIVFDLATGHVWSRQTSVVPPQHLTGNSP
ncbi:chemoreceptor glutamine deamidase CheD [Viridibacterium curvum]|uniref:Probable chemoreceptor glutamine deamidase CheD n=2 Tax=Viridibacterium curvum TaxID=1101404 RepID=A0ABP9QX11_9RHOO